MRRDLKGKRAILTGASRRDRPGRGTGAGEGRRPGGSRRPLGRQARTSCRNELRTAGGEVFAVATDVTVPADRRTARPAAVELFGGLDLLVNNAGVGSWGHFADSTEAINRDR